MTQQSDLEKIQAIIRALPQREHLTSENIESWIAKTSEIDDHGPVWHARRLRGIGSSEIGVCVMSARGEHTPFGGAREMVMSKLMMLAPDAGTSHTKRGNEMEDFIRQKFHREYGTKSETEMMNRMMNTVVNATPWMVGNPDDLCFINGQLYLIDYKAPSSDVMQEAREAGGVKFEYVCQLHHLHEIGRYAGLPIVGKLLCSFDYDNYELDVREVEHDQALLDEMRAVGDELWNEFVCKGQLPAIPLPEYIEDVSPEDLQVISELAETAAIADGIAKNAALKATQSKAAILELTKKYRIGESRIKLPGSYIKSKKELDVESLAVYAGMFGIELDTQNPESIQGALDRLLAEGYPNENFELEIQQFAFSRSKKGLDYELLQACAEIGQKTVNEKLEAYEGKFLGAFGLQRSTFSSCVNADEKSAETPSRMVGSM